MEHEYLLKKAYELEVLVKGWLDSQESWWIDKSAVCVLETDGEQNTLKFEVTIPFAADAL